MVDSGAQALSGVRVLDLTRFPPGQFCTVMLADLGADVVRVDAPGWNPMFAGVGTGIGRAKRSIALDLRNPLATQVLRRLAGAADVVVDNNRPGDLDDRGFGPKTAAQEFPSLIWCSITGYGQDGPYRGSLVMTSPIRPSRACCRPSTRRCLGIRSWCWRSPLLR